MSAYHPSLALLKSLPPVATVTSLDDVPFLSEETLNAPGLPTPPAGFIWLPPAPTPTAGSGGYKGIIKSGATTTAAPKNFAGGMGGRSFVPMPSTGGNSRVTSMPSTGGNSRFTSSSAATLLATGVSSGNSTNNSSSSINNNNNTGVTSPSSSSGGGTSMFKRPTATPAAVLLPPPLHHLPRMICLTTGFLLRMRVVQLIIIIQ